MKGIVALTLLRSMEKCLGPEQYVHDHFDVAFGTSSGAFIILEIFSSQTAVEECLPKFLQLAQRCFQPNRRQSALTYWFFAFLAWWFNDSRYTAEGLEAVLQELFGLQRRLFDTRPFESADTKIAVTATEIGDGHLCLLTNYNGTGRQSGSSYGPAYEHLRPRNAVLEPFLWEA